MHNFRQYYGQQSLEFGSQDNQELVTVILGENGRGKTGIYRAILFALYGDKKLEQDSSDAEVILTNTKALQEDAVQGRKGIHCSVTLDFVHEGESYKIERSLYSILAEDGKVVEKSHEQTLQSLDGDMNLTDIQQIQQWVDGILDSRVKNYFFFDGERIERLTRAAVNQKTEIATGIKNLLKIDHLLKAKEVLAHIRKQSSKELQKLSTGAYQQKLKQQLDTEEKIEHTAGEIQNLMKKAADLEHEIHVIDEQLRAFEDKQAEISRRKELEKQLDKEEPQLVQSLQRLKEFNKYLPFLLAKDALYASKAKIDAYLGETNEDASISLDLVDNILENLHCICGTSIQEGSREYAALQSLRKSVSYKLEKIDYFDLKGKVMQLLGMMEDKEKDLQFLLDLAEQHSREVEEIKSSIDYYNQKLKETNIEDLGMLNEKRQACAEEKIKLQVHLENRQEDLKALQAEKEQIDLALRELKVQSGVHQQLSYKLEEIEKAIKAMDQLIKDFENDVISELELVSTQNLRYLLDESGQMNIKNVKVQEDYSLEVMNHFGQPFLANISQGQRQVLSLSFITALAQVAGGTETLEMPLFMDTPFGRLSGKHQHNLLNFIPNVCSQWILLVTDKEFGTSERMQFLEQGQVGKFYVLESIEPGVTQIKEQELHANI